MPQKEVQGWKRDADRMPKRQAEVSQEMKRTAKRLDQAYKNALCLPIHKGSRIVMMSDCHRGVGNWGDNFLANQNLFFAALQYYNQRKLNWAMVMNYGRTGISRRFCRYTITNFA